VTEQLKELIWHLLSALPDPQVHFKPEHKRNVRMVRNALQKPQGKVHKLSKPILRNSFLFGCLEFTKDEPVEHLIVGFGRRFGGGTDISAVYHITGNETSVSVPPQLQKLIKDHAETSPSAETIIFHNHPKAWYQNILPKIPLASSTDRRTMIAQKYFKPFFLLRGLFGEATVRFYVGEQGKVQEIRWPYLRDLWELFKGLQQGGRR